MEISTPAGDDLDTTPPRLAGELVIRTPAPPGHSVRRPPRGHREVEVRVVLQVLVGTTGHVEHVSVRRSDQPGSRFEQSAVDALRAARFEPALRGEETVSAWALVQVSFPSY